MGKGVAFTQARRKDTKAVAAATAVQGGGAATQMCHGHPGHAGARAGRPWHGFGCGYAALCLCGESILLGAGILNFLPRKTRIYGIATQSEDLSWGNSAAHLRRVVV
jgi:hypothetical protein